jgi:hypothetical protein
MLYRKRRSLLWEAHKNILCGKRAEFLVSNVAVYVVTTKFQMVKSTHNSLDIHTALQYIKIKHLTSACQQFPLTLKMIPSYQQLQ